jgi:hypothetical protein
VTNNNKHFSGFLLVFQMKDLITFVKGLLGNVKTSLAVTRIVERTGEGETNNVLISITLFKDGSEIGLL